MSREYNALFGPAPGWLRLSEDERLEQVLRYHQALRLPHPATPKPRVHAAMHVMVEDQVALGEPPFVRETLERLLGEGLNRHEGVHAIAQVGADLVMAAGLGRKYDTEAHEASLRLLNAKALGAQAQDD